MNSYAAVLASICHEYIEFGLEAFNNNKFKQICIQHEDHLLLARPIFRKTNAESGEQTDQMKNQLQMEDELFNSQQLLLLCFICDVNCQLGAINIQMRTLADNLSEQM